MTLVEGIQGQDRLAYDHLAERVGSGEAWNPVTLRREAAFAGWAGLDLPRRVGGAGLGALDMARIFRDCGRVDLELRDLPGGAHARFVTLASSRRFDDFLAAVARAEAFCAVAITEPDVGSDLHAIRTTATRVEGGYRIDGAKQHISRIAEATHFVVFAAVARGDGSRLITAFLVPRDAPGLTVEEMAPMGMSTVSWGRVRLEGVVVDAGQRIGGEGQALSMFVRHFAYWRTMMTAASIGSAQAAIDQSIERLKSRTAFGGPIGRFTHLQQGLAEAVARVHMAWLLIEEVAGAFGEHRWPIFDAGMAKAEGIEAAIFAVDWAMRVHGANGYDTDTGLEKRYRDLLGLRVADGTTDVLRGQVARAILGEHLYELSLNREPKGAILNDARRRFW